MDQPQLSYCEPSNATLYSRWHIREIGPGGRFPGGGLTELPRQLAKLNPPEEPAAESREPATPTMRDLRTELVRTAVAHQKRAELAVEALLRDRATETPPWLNDAWRGSSMASLYARILATVLAAVAQETSAKVAGDIEASVRLMLENGTEDENIDIWPVDEAGKPL